MRPNCSRLVCTDGRVFVFFGECSNTRRFGYPVYPDGSFGSPVLALSADFASGFECYQLNDEECEPDFLQVINQRPAAVEVVEVVIDLPLGLVQYGAFKFGKFPNERSFVRIHKPVYDLGDCEW